MGQITPDAQEMLHPNMNDNQKDEYYAGDLILADDMNKDMNSIVHDLQKLYYLTTAAADEDAPTGYDNTFIQYHRLNLENKITNNDIAVGAAIAYSKLNLANSIKNNDVATNAAIAYSKLNLSGSVKDADVAANAAIQKSKLALTGTITNEDVADDAAITYSKLNLTGSVKDADVATNAAIQKSKLALTGTITNADVANNAAIVYSKLSLTGSIKDADVATDAAIQKSKLALTGTITKADFNGNSFTGTGRIPVGWIDGETPSPYLPIDVDEGVLGGTDSTNLYQHVFANKGYLTASNSDGRLVTTSITSSRANSVLNRSNITARTGIPTWDVYGLVTGGTTVNTNKYMYVNGEPYNCITTNDSLPTFYAPRTLGTNGQILSVNNNNFSWVSPNQNKINLNDRDYSFTLTSNTTAKMYAPITPPATGYTSQTNICASWDSTNRCIWKQVTVKCDNSSQTISENTTSNYTIQPMTTRGDIIVSFDYTYTGSGYPVSGGYYAQGVCLELQIQSASISSNITDLPCSVIILGCYRKNSGITFGKTYTVTYLITAQNSSTAAIHPRFTINLRYNWLASSLALISAQA